MVDPLQKIGFWLFGLWSWCLQSRYPLRDLNVTRGLIDSLTENEDQSANYAENNQKPGTRNMKPFSYWSSSAGAVEAILLK